MECIFKDNLYYRHFKKYIYIENNELHLINYNPFHNFLFYLKWIFLYRFCSKEIYFKITICNAVNPSVLVFSEKNKKCPITTTWESHYFNGSITLQNCILFYKKYPYFIEHMYGFKDLDYENCSFIED